MLPFAADLINDSSKVLFPLIMTVVTETPQRAGFNLGELFEPDIFAWSCIFSFYNSNSSLLCIFSNLLSVILQFVIFKNFPPGFCQVLVSTRTQL